MRTEQDGSGRDAVGDAWRLIDVARREARSGSVARAWAACVEAAAIGREQGDAEILAVAATVVTDPSIVSWRSIPARQAMCLEALGMLGPPGSGDARTQTLRELVANHLDALSSGWAERLDAPSTLLTSDEVEARFTAVRAGYGRAAGPGAATARLALAGEALQLGRVAADDAILAWGRMWQLDALQQLGLRVEFNTALGEFAAVVARLDSPVWRWRLAAVHACVALMEDRLDDLPNRVTAMREAGVESGADEAPFIDLILRAAIAQRVGEGLVDVEIEVRDAIAAAPFFAQGWRANLLVAQGRQEEALALWRALAPHVEEVPPTSHEWLIASVGHAELAILAGDRAIARRLLDVLRPYENLHVASPAMTPYGGPVALALARLAAFLGDRVAAARWSRDAVERSEWMGAPWYAALSREAAVGMGSPLAPLSPRETDVALMIADGQSNREMAETLFLSERTVEQHTRSILRKLGLSNRAAVAAWVTRAR